MAERCHRCVLEQVCWMRVRQKIFNLLPGYREDHTGPPPPYRPTFSPPQNPSTVIQAAFRQQMGVGGPPGPHIAANGANIQPPPISLPQYPSTVPFLAPFPQYWQMGLGGPPGPHMPALGTNIQHLNQYMPWYHEQFLQSTIPQTQSMVSGTSGGNYGSQTAYSSSSYNADSMDTGMANLSLNDFRPQIPAHPSPPTSFSSDPQIGPKPTDQMGSNPSTSAVRQGSHSNPSPARHMNERDMVDSHSPPTKDAPHGINPNRPPPPASTSPSDFPPSSSSGPSFNAYYGQDSLNGNSFVDPTGKHSGIFYSMICLS